MSLSKSKYIAGLQCPRRLWLACHEPEAGAPPSEGSPFDQGDEIGRRARDLFPGGVLVDEEAWQHGQATARTRQLMADRNVGAIFEAAFVHAGVRVRVDVLERLGPRTWGLREVKQGASVKDVYLDDAAVQRFVVEGAGVRLRSVEIVHVNRDYVRGDDGIDWRHFFQRADVTAETAALLPDVPARVRAPSGCSHRPRRPTWSHRRTASTPTAASSGTAAPPPSRRTGSSADCPASRTTGWPASRPPASSASRTSPTTSGSAPCRRIRAAWRRGRAP